VCRCPQVGVQFSSDWPAHWAGVLIEWGLWMLLSLGLLANENSGFLMFHEEIFQFLTSWE